MSNVSLKLRWTTTTPCLAISSLFLLVRHDLSFDKYMLVVPSHLLALHVPGLVFRRIWTLHILGWPACSPPNLPSALFKGDYDVFFCRHQGITSIATLMSVSFVSILEYISSIKGLWLLSCPIHLGECLQYIWSSFPDDVLKEIFVVFHRCFPASAAVEIWLFLIPSLFAWAMLP